MVDDSLILPFLNALRNVKDSDKKEIEAAILKFWKYNWMMFQRDYPSSHAFFLSKNEHSPNCFVSLALKFPLPFLYK